LPVLGIANSRKVAWLVAVTGVLAKVYSLFVTPATSTAGAGVAMLAGVVATFSSLPAASFTHTYTWYVVLSTSAGTVVLPAALRELRGDTST